ncbi:hypothetical protein [Streptomyces sp. NPDC051561]|uniref:hypothetical protein n=1 Tax=Streptomyces sp. NPDC051561 TaxID=3365658 RepID=UPI00378CD8EC
MDDAKPSHRPAPVLRPGLDARTRDLILRGQVPGNLRMYYQALVFAGFLVASLFLLLMLSDTTLGDLLLRRDPDGFDRTQQALPLFGAALGVLALTGVALGAGSTATTHTARKAAANPGNRVDPAAELTDEAGVLLARTQQACTRIRASQVHQHGLIDRERNVQQLPDEEWEIAVALRTYSGLVSTAPEEPHGKAVADLVARRRQSLDNGLKPLIRRVEALETYAEQTIVADARYREVEQLHQLGDHDQVLDFLARTARDELAVAELDALSEEAAAITEAFTQALHETREHAALALPQHPAP